MVVRYGRYDVFVHAGIQDDFARFDMVLRPAVCQIALVGGNVQAFLQLDADVVQRALYGIGRHRRTVGFGYVERRCGNTAVGIAEGRAQGRCQRFELADVGGIGIVFTCGDRGNRFAAVVEAV